MTDEKTTAPPAPKGFGYYLGSDLLGLVFSWIPTLFCWTCGVQWFWHFWSPGPRVLCLLTPFMALLGLFFIQFLFRMLLPRLKRGVYPATPNKMLISWWSQVLMARSLDMTGMRNLVMATGFLRFLYFRSLGAKISYKTSISLNVSMVDFPLISVEDEAFIGEGTTILCHSMVNDRFMLKKVEIKKNAFVGGSCTIGMGTVLKENSYLGFRNILYNHTVEAGEKVPDFEYDRGPKRSHEA